MTGRPINALELYSRFKDQWDTTSQPLKERASILPLGQYEDGRVGLAWPGLLAAPAEGMVNFGRYGYDTPEAIRDNAASAFDVAGGAVTGGLGLGLAGGLADNSVGIFGGRLAKTADQNALERSGAQPQGIRAYHGTNREFDTFDPAFMGSRGQTDEGAFFFGGPKLASEYADGEFSIPDARRSELYQANLTPDGRLKVADYNRALEAEMEQTAFGRVIPADIDTSNFATRNFGGYRWDRDEGAKLNRAIAEAKAEGKSGLTIQGMTDATGIMDPQYAVWGRGTVFSPTTGEILYSGAPTASAVPLAGETDTDPALIEFLRSQGLL